jgi:hypothetical protein
MKWVGLDLCIFFSIMSHRLFGLILFLLILSIFSLLVILSHVLLPSISGVFWNLLLYLGVCSWSIRASPLIWLIIRSSTIYHILLIRHILVQFYIWSFLKSLVVCILLIVDWSSSSCTCILLLLELILSCWFLLILSVSVLISKNMLRTVEIYICVWYICLTFGRVRFGSGADGIVWSHDHTVAHI